MAELNAPTANLADRAWAQLAGLKPSLPTHIEIQRRNYAGELWFLLHDKATGRFHRFSPRAYQLLKLMNGNLNLEQLYRRSQQVAVPDGEQPASREEVIELLQYLHVADLLLCDMPPDTAELFKRREASKSSRWKTLMLNPAIWRFPLGNPDKLLDKLQPLARLISHPLVGVVWLAVVGYALLQLVNHWSQVSSGQLNQLMSAENLFLLWLTYPLLKVLHELGHALFTKAWGGQIHECGVVIAMLAPLPYVDATAATAFDSKARRMMVGAAGMAVELFVAAVALLLWLQVEDGLLRSILFNLMVLGSISTLFFNGNPLLRFDGYHLLCDWFDSPNLGTRANRQFSYLVQRYGYGIGGLHPPARGVREAFWLTLYAVAAFCYRLFVLVAIILLAANHFPTLGLLLGLWLAIFQIGLPFLKKILFLLHNPALGSQRPRALGVTAALAAALIGFIAFVPLPQSTSAEGVLWLPEEARVRVTSSGFIEQLLVSDGDTVEPGQALIQLANPRLETELKIQQALLREYRARYQQVWKSDRSQAAVFVQDIEAIEAEVALLSERVAQLTLYARSSGTFELQLDNPLGSFVKQGTQIAAIAEPRAPRIRVVLTQDEVALVQDDSRSIGVRLAQRPSQTLNAKMTEQVPAAANRLPSPVLGAAGGGRISVERTDQQGLRTHELVFLLDLELTDERTSPPYFFGQRAWVHFEHSGESLGTRLYRALQQQFLRLASK